MKVFWCKMYLSHAAILILGFFILQHRKPELHMPSLTSSFFMGRRLSWVSRNTPGSFLSQRKPLLPDSSSAFNYPVTPPPTEWPHPITALGALRGKRSEPGLLKLRRHFILCSYWRRQKRQTFLSGRKEDSPYWHRVPLKPTGHWHIWSPVAAHWPPCKHVLAPHAPKTDAYHKIQDKDADVCNRTFSSSIIAVNMKFICTAASQQSRIYRHVTYSLCRQPVSSPARVQPGQHLYTVFKSALYTCRYAV